MVEEEGYSNTREALPDTWISNYANTYDMPINAAYREAANVILDNNDNDMDIVQEVMAGMGAAYNYQDAYDFYDILTAVTGIDGYVTEWEHKGEKSQIVLAFNSNQFKRTDNENPTSHDDIRYAKDINEAIKQRRAEQQQKVAEQHDAVVAGAEKKRRKDKAAVNDTLPDKLKRTEAKLTKAEARARDYVQQNSNLRKQVQVLKKNLN